MNNKIVTINEAYLKYINYAELHLKPTTILNIKRKFKLHILPFISNKNIYEFSENDYIYWQKCIKDLNYSNSFNKSIQSLFKRFFDYLSIFYKIDNVARKMIDFKDYKIVENKEKEILSFKDFKKFIKCIKNDILYNTLFDFLYFTGVRKGELLALNWNDLNHNSVSITKTITKEFFNGKRLITTPKTNGSIRSIVIDKKLIEKLNKLKKYYIHNNKDFTNDYFIFGGSKPIATTTLERKKNYYCDKAKVKRIRIHDFRHSHATLLYKNKCDIKTIQKRLGHSNINTTLDTYVHCDNEKRVRRTLNFIRLIF